MSVRALLLDRSERNRGSLTRCGPRGFVPQWRLRVQVLDCLENAIGQPVTGNIPRGY